MADHIKLMISIIGFRHVMWTALCRFAGLAVSISTHVRCFFRLLWVVCRQIRNSKNDTDIRKSISFETTNGIGFGGSAYTIQKYNIG